MEKHLHIISFEVPYPADDGSVYDLFYKLPALQQQGIKIYLHCFVNDQGEQPELNEYCAAVYYYKLKATGADLFSNLPYTVAARKNEELVQRLLKDDYPIFMEGVHCSFITGDKRFKGRKMFIRISKVENKYHRQLFKYSNSIKTKIYYLVEAMQLKNYEKKLAKNATAYWATAQPDADYYTSNLDCKTMDYLPLFLPAWKVSGTPGMGSYCLYHGNLQPEENEYAVTWLLNNVFKNLQIPFIVAGKNPSKKLTALSAKNPYSCIVSNPDDNQMQDIISKAHINILPSFNATGFKVKLLNALYNGRHCIVNDAMVAGTAVVDLCHIVNTASEFINRIHLIYHQPFTTEEIELREKILYKEYSNEANAKQIVKWIWQIYA